jgi:hypothetical protein
MEEVQARITEVPSNESSYMDWPAVMAGSVLAAAISLVMLTFGSAIGLSLTSAREGASGMSLTGFAIAGALWLVWVQVSGFMAGGYLTGRMRRRNYDATEHESDIRDGAHGLTVWGVGVLVGAVIAVSGISTAVSTATSAVGSVGSQVASAAAGVAGNDALVDRLLRAGAPAASATASGDSAGLSQQERDEVMRIISASVASGKLEDADRQYLVDRVAARTGLPPEEVQQRVDQAWAQAQQLEAQAREAAERARKLGILAAFATAASLLLGAVGAYYGAVMGGNHRDKQVVFETWAGRW